ncbi:AraC family transcriptional regulator [Pseudochelatococcus sp. B33]
MRENVSTSHGRNSTPIARHLLFQTTDIDEAREKVGSVFCRHDIDYAGRRRQLSCRQNFVPMGRLALSYITYGEDVAIDAGEPENWFMVHSIDRSPCEMRVGRRDLIAAPGMDVVSSATLGLKMKWAASSAQLVLKVERPALEQHLASLLNDRVRLPIEFLPDPTVAAGRDPGYRRLLDFIITEAEQDDTFFRSQWGGRCLEETIMTLLLTRFPNNYSDALAAPASPAAPRHVRLAEEFMAARAGDAISVGDIAAAAGVSIRTLFEGFRHFRGTTPMASLRTIRLEAVRDDLLSASGAASVTDIALRWGFTNLGRFAEVYRRRYGELPSQTLRRLP